MAEENHPSSIPPAVARSEVPAFERNQVLLAEQLNAVVAHFDAQVRASRLYALGTGIVEGLEIRWSDEGELIARPGAALTTVGALIALPAEVTWTHAAPYVDVRPDEALLPADWDWGGVDDDLWVLGSAALPEAMPIADVLTPAVRAQGLVVLLLERAEYDISPCEAVESCRDQGRRVEWTLRPLFVAGGRDRRAALGLDAADAPPGIGAVGISAPRLDTRLADLEAAPEATLRDLYADAAHAALRELRASWGDVEAFANRLAAGPAPRRDEGVGPRLKALAARLADDADDRFGLDAALACFDFAADLARTLDGLRALAAEIDPLGPPPANRFPWFVSLGSPTDPEDDALRHGFRPAGELGREAARRRAWLGLRRRFALQVLYFEPEAAPPPRVVPRRRPDALEVVPGHYPDPGDALTETECRALWGAPEVRADAPPDARLLADARDLFVEGLRGAEVGAVAARLAVAGGVGWRRGARLEVIDLDAPARALDGAQAEDYAAARRVLIGAANRVLLVLGGTPPLEREPALATLAGRRGGWAALTRALVAALPPTAGEPGADGADPVEPARAAWLDVLAAAAGLLWIAELTDWVLTGDAAAPEGWIASTAGRYHAFVASWIAELRAAARALFAVDAAPVFDALAAGRRPPRFADFVARHPALAHRPGVPPGGTLVVLARGGVVVADLALPGCCDAVPPARAVPLVPLYVEVPVGRAAVIADLRALAELPPEGWSIEIDDEVVIDEGHTVDAILAEAARELRAADISEEVRAAYLGGLEGLLEGRGGKRIVPGIAGGILGPGVAARPTLPAVPGAPGLPGRPTAPRVDDDRQVVYTARAAGVTPWHLRVVTKAERRTLAELRVWVAARHRPLFAADDRLFTLRRPVHDAEADPRTVTLPLAGAVDGRPVEYSVVDRPVKGEVRFVDGALVYTPRPGEVGDDALIYKVALPGGADRVALARVAVHIADCCAPEETPEEPEEPEEGPLIRIPPRIFLGSDAGLYPVLARPEVSDVRGEGIERRFGDVPGGGVRPVGLDERFEWVAGRIGERVDADTFAGGPVVSVSPGRIEPERVAAVELPADRFAVDGLADAAVLAAKRGWGFRPSRVEFARDVWRRAVEITYAWTVDVRRVEATYTVDVWRTPSSALEVAASDDRVRMRYPMPRPLAATPEVYGFAWSARVEGGGGARSVAIDGRGPTAEVEIDAIGGGIEAWNAGDAARLRAAIAGRPVWPNHGADRVVFATRITVSAIAEVVGRGAPSTLVERVFSLAPSPEMLPQYTWTRFDAVYGPQLDALPPTLERFADLGALRELLRVLVDLEAAARDVLTGAEAGEGGFESVDDQVWATLASAIEIGRKAAMLRIDLGRAVGEATGCALAACHRSGTLPGERTRAELKRQLRRAAWRPDLNPALDEVRAAFAEVDAAPELVEFIAELARVAG